MPNDKGLLKKELYQDQAKLIDAICKERDVALKRLLQESLDMINKYILICVIIIIPSFSKIYFF